MAMAYMKDKVEKDNLQRMRDDVVGAEYYENLKAFRKKAQTRSTAFKKPAGKESEMAEEATDKGKQAMNKRKEKKPTEEDLPSEQCPTDKPKKKRKKVAKPCTPEEGGETDSGNPEEVGETESGKPEEGGAQVESQTKQVPEAIAESQKKEEPEPTTPQRKPKKRKLSPMPDEVQRSFGHVWKM